ncbi:MAG: hypothetical protein PUP93_04625 [Rhizonema sp. NSF051]|nr:hypothetical protein [Rhizonema sp. NSF051]
MTCDFPLDIPLLPSTRGAEIKLPWGITLKPASQAFYFCSGGRLVPAG